MRSGHRGLLIAGAVALAAPALPGTSTGPAQAAQGRSSPATLCEADETILFQCRSGMKLVSLCGRRTPRPGARLLYGNPGHLDYASSSEAGFSYTEHGREIDVQVHDGDREHGLYSGGAGGSLDADGRLGSYSIDGLVIDRGNGVGVDHRCAGEASRHGRVQDFMPEGDETNE